MANTKKKVLIIDKNDFLKEEITENCSSNKICLNGAHSIIFRKENTLLNSLVTITIDDKSLLNTMVVTINPGELKTRKIISNSARRGDYRLIISHISFPFESFDTIEMIARMKIVVN